MTEFCVRVLQSGLATKVDKASRKLRKERKNRAKKVHPIPITSSTFTQCLLPLLLPVPRYQKDQGCRAREEEVNADLLFYSILHIYTRFSSSGMYVLVLCNALPTICTMQKKLKSQATQLLEPTMVIDGVYWGYQEHATKAV